MRDWSPAAYLAFRHERTEAARDLLARVPDVPGSIIDMGCGPGNSTRLLVERFGTGRVTGLDSSEAMLERARAELPGVRFDSADAASWLPPEGTGLVFANAVYQWVAEPLAVLGRTFEAMAPGSVLAVQMPDNVREPNHRLMAESAADPRWRGRIGTAGRDPLPPAEAFYDRLSPFAAGSVEIWRTTYHHVLADADAIVRFVTATGLRPYLDPLTPPEQAGFLAAYRAAIEVAYPPRADGRVLLGFPRLFIVAVRRTV